MEYKDIERVNAEIKPIELGQKNYAMVSERVTAFRKLFPEGFIKTEVIHNDGTNVMMQARVGYYLEDHSEFVLATGFAQETKGRGMVNGTSWIENCETGAVGRALGFISLGTNGGGICSAEELANAVVGQKQIEDEWKKKKTDIEQKKLAELEKPAKKDAPSKVETVSTVPGW